MWTAAAQAGRDPAQLEYTRWVSASISAADADAHAALGVTRLVAALGSPDLDGQREEMSALARSASASAATLASCTREVTSSWMGDAPA